MILKMAICFLFMFRDQASDSICTGNIENWIRLNLFSKKNVQQILWVRILLLKMEMFVAFFVSTDD